jgi:hypothetical protein
VVRARSYWYVETASILRNMVVNELRSQEQEINLKELMKLGALRVAAYP